MGEPLDDFNRRTAAGRGSWAMGPPKNAAESAAQSMLDAQQSNPPAGGGSIDFGVVVSAIILLIGIALFAGGSYALDNLREGGAIMGILVLIVSGFAMLIGGGGLAVAGIKGLGSTGGRLTLILAVASGLAVWWLASRWFIVPTMPRPLIGLAAAALVFLVMGRRGA